MMAGLVTGAYAGLAMVVMLPPEMDMMEGVVTGANAGVLTSDASGSWGCGAFTSAGEWFQLKLPETWGCVHQDKRAGSGGDGYSHVGETVARGHHQMPMRQCSSGSNLQVRKEQGGEGHATHEEPLLLLRGIQCNGSGGTHTRG